MDGEETDTFPFYFDDNFLIYVRSIHRSIACATKLQKDVDHGQGWNKSSTKSTIEEKM